MKKFIALFLLAGLWPSLTLGAGSFTYSAWIPYWQKTAGVPVALENIQKMQEVSPFAYEVQPDGTLADKLKVDQSPWPAYFTALRSQKVKIIPSILWIDGGQIYKILSDPALRAAHEANIMEMLLARNWDGVDIDYENKTAETKPYFSAFVKELAAEIHKNKKLMTCAIEPRTPLADRFVTAPKDIEYANDYKVLNAACDEFRIMAYDQKNIDLKLNKTKGKDILYAPVADPTWVTKVVNEAVRGGVGKKKIMLGVPSYGYEYRARDEGPYRIYARLRSVGYADAMALAQSLNIKPQRNSAGELSFSYYVAQPTSTPGAPQGSTRLVWWSDAKSVDQKIQLAKRLGLKGVIMFKIDGASDPSIWSKFK